MGSTYEGLFYSLGLTMRDLYFNKSLEKTPKERIKRAKLAIHDM